jgi:hypothetical protein
MSSLDRSSSRSPESNVDWQRYSLVALVTVVAAVVATSIIYFIGSVVVGYNPQFVVLSNVSPTIIFTIVPALVAVILYAILLRFTANPARTFAIIAVIVLILSLIPDLTYIPSVPGASGPQTAVLMVMHIVAAVVIVWTLTTFARPQSS